MKHIITITGDMNDADDSSCSNSVDLDELVFEGWGGRFDALKITYSQFFTAFGEVLQDISKQRPHSSNWSDRTYRDGSPISSRGLVLMSLREKLDLTELLDYNDLMEVLWDFIPGTCDYPVHTIYSITALPEEGQITFY